MKGAISLGRILGIRVFIHFTFFFIFLWRGYTAYNEGNSWNIIVFECLVVAAVFLCVLMHEYGHALAARRYGIQTRQIVLLPIGGVAQLEQMPENPKQELIVALCGPLVNVGIALLLLPVVLIQYPLKHFSEDQYMDIIINSFTARLLLINILLIVFNMIPAFPMDGGRVLRALLGFRLRFVQATRIAARIGQLLAIGFVVAGFYYNIFWILIGIFVFFGAEMELRMISRKYKIRTFSVQEALLEKYPVIKPGDLIVSVAERIVQAEEKDFIVAEKGKVAGILTQEKLVETLSGNKNAQKVSEVMQTSIPKLSAADPAELALQYMKACKTSILPVYKGWRLAGAVSEESIMQRFLAFAAGNN